MQWLSNTKLVSYPTNLLSRFYASPYIGARIQQLLTDPVYDYRNELGDVIRQTTTYESITGKTKGLLEPHEFWYFWHRFVPSTEIRYLTREEETRIDKKGLLRGLAALERAFNKPFATKAKILQYNLRNLYDIYPNCLFLFIQRHPIYTCQSILESRIKWYGDLNTWWAAKPPQYELLRDKDPYTQIAGQVYFTNQEIRNQLAMLNTRNVASISYENFCDSPAKTFKTIKNKLAALGYVSKIRYNGPTSFEITNNIRLKTNQFKRICEAYNILSGEDVKP